MSSSLDMSLDEIIRKNQGSTRGRKGNSRGKFSGSGTGADRRAPSRDLIRTTPYRTPQQMKAMEEGMMRQQQQQQQQKQTIPGGGINKDTGTKLYVSNLDDGVSNADILLLFSDVGELKKHSIHYDKSGRSKGTAEVVFYRHADALAAIERYNNVCLDGKPIKIELVGSKVIVSDPVPSTKNITLENLDVGFRSVIDSGQNRVGAKQRVHGGGLASAARHRGQGDYQGGKTPTKEELDAELDKYRSEAVRIK